MKKFLDPHTLPRIIPLRAIHLRTKAFFAYPVSTTTLSYSSAMYLPPYLIVSGSVADPDPGSGAFLPPGSGIRIRDEFFPDL
jgi:hypothetical protein